MRNLLRAVPISALALLVAHQLTYQRTPHTTGGHNHAGMLATQNWLPGLPSILLVLAVGGFALAFAGTRKTPHPVRLATTIGIQLTLFTLLTFADRLLHGCGLLPDLGTLTLATAIQIASGIAMWATARYIARQIAHLSAPSPLLPARTRARQVVDECVTGYASLLPRTSLAPRAPPAG